jgi:hypothetical protein
MTYTKQQQLHSKRIKPTQRQMGEISPKVREAVKERSEGICEVCGRARAVHMAHLIGRPHVNERTTADILSHVCLPCHRWLDGTAEGMQFKKMRMMEE